MATSADAWRRARENDARVVEALVWVALTYANLNWDWLVRQAKLDDLQKKAAKLGGNVALMTPQRKTKGGYFGLQDYMTADVYSCQGTSSAR